MSIFSYLKGIISGDASNLREASGTTIDSDEDQWRRLSGDANRDLSPVTQERMQKLALYIWERNLIGNRIVELPTAFMLAEGVRLTSEDEESQGWLDAFWADPINKLDIKLERKVRELALYGEQCWPVFVNEMSGHTRLGYLDPALIKDVISDPDNADQPIGIVTKRDKAGRNRKYRIIVNGPETVFTESTRQLRDQFQDGECFFFMVNGISTGRRGRSDLLAQADWIDGYDQFLFGELDRAQFLRAFIWDVTMKGATPDQVEARAKQISTPPPASVRVHNDSEIWNSLSPNLSGSDNAISARIFRNHILGGATIPEHWFGGGGDVNRASASEMGEPTYKTMTMRQTYLKHMLEEVGLYVLRKRRMANGESDYNPEVPEERYQLEVEFPELTTRDTSKYAGAVQQVAVAATVAINNGLMTRLSAIQMISAMAQRIGVEIDPQKELDNAAQEAAAEAMNDVFQEPTVPQEPATPQPQAVQAG